MVLIQELANKDNAITQVIQSGNEYEIYVDYWDGKKLVFKTVGCKGIVYNPDIISEIGDFGRFATPNELPIYFLFP